MFAVIRVRGQADVNVDVRRTMELMNLTRVNHCVLIPDNDVTKGMLQKAKDYITWGEVNAETLTQMITVRGRLSGDAAITDEYLKANTEFATVAEMAAAVIGSGYRMKDAEGAKAVFRLHPPAKGYKGIKRSFRNGGALGYRGDAINELIARML
ncbi:MAG: 50S ribosomal protein L30 [Methanomassiliicoccaceae archaeon]|jgi:large subunit ribosomal protein L30|nr:50S ribosomal protein L30 [Methanomassiliicoccaceae archaeon]